MTAASDARRGKNETARACDYKDRQVRKLHKHIYIHIYIHIYVYIYIQAHGMDLGMPSPQGPKYGHSTYFGLKYIDMTYFGLFGSPKARFQDDQLWAS